MYNIKKNVLLRRARNIKCIHLENEGILYNPSKEDKYLANITCMIIWDFIDGSRTVQKIIEEFATICEVAQENIEDDICSQIAMLQELGFVEEVKASSEIYV